MDDVTTSERIRVEFNIPEHISVCDVMDAGRRIRFELPDTTELRQRLAMLLRAVASTLDTD